MPSLCCTFLWASPRQPRPSSHCMCFTISFNKWLAFLLLLHARRARHLSPVRQLLPQGTASLRARPTCSAPPHVPRLRAIIMPRCKDADYVAASRCPCGPPRQRASSVLRKAASLQAACRLCGRRRLVRHSLCSRVRTPCAQPSPLGCHLVEAAVSGRA